MVEKKIIDTVAKMTAVSPPKPSQVLTVVCVEAYSKIESVKLMEGEALHDCMREVYCAVLQTAEQDRQIMPQISVSIKSLEPLKFEVKGAYQLTHSKV